MLDKMEDKDIITFYKTEYFKEWDMACKNGIRLTARDIKERLMSK